MARLYAGFDNIIEKKKKTRRVFYIRRTKYIRCFFTLATATLRAILFFFISRRLGLKKTKNYKKNLTRILYFRMNTGNAMYRFYFLLSAWAAVRVDGFPSERINRRTRVYPTDCDCDETGTDCPTIHTGERTFKNLSPPTLD